MKRPISRLEEAPGFLDVTFSWFRVSCGEVFVKSLEFPWLEMQRASLNVKVVCPCLRIPFSVMFWALGNLSTGTSSFLPFGALV